MIAKQQEESGKAGVCKSHLDIVIVNWNSLAHLKRCLDSIPCAYSNEFDLGAVVVVDNGSNDGSREWLETIRRVPLSIPLIVVFSPENLGFARACNLGAAKCSSELLLFLNPDTRLYSDSLLVPIRFLSSSTASSVGIVSIQTVDDEGHIAVSCARFPRPINFMLGALGLDVLLPGSRISPLMKEWRHDEDRDVDQVIGAFFLVRRGLFVSLQGFDQRFFVYFEEVDFSLRARKCGWQSRFLASARCFHKGGGASGQAKADRLVYLVNSRIIYSRTHFSALSFGMVVLTSLFIEPFARAALALAGRSSLTETICAYGRIWATLPSTLRIANERRIG
jgi:GT2 family glycosyltransferase